MQRKAEGVTRDRGALGMYLRWLGPEDAKSKGIGVLPPDETTNKLKAFPLETRRMMTKSLVSSLCDATFVAETQAQARARMSSRMPESGLRPRSRQRPPPAWITTASGPSKVSALLPNIQHVRWAMDIVGHCFSLPLDDSDDRMECIGFDSDFATIAAATKLYFLWLGEGENSAQGALLASSQDQSGSAAGGRFRRPSCLTDGSDEGQLTLKTAFEHFTLIFERRNGLTASQRSR